MEHMLGWNALKCMACECTYFVQRVGLSSQPGRGLVTTPAGWQCGKCGLLMDSRAAARLQQIERLKAEQDALLEELEEMESAEPRPTVGEGAS